jgi:hypothetical protein
MTSDERPRSQKSSSTLTSGTKSIPALPPIASQVGHIITLLMVTHVTRKINNLPFQRPKVNDLDRDSQAALSKKLKWFCVLTR